MNSVTSKLVKFVNTQDYVINFGCPCKISVEYLVDQKIRVTSEDWVAIFPEGCDFWSSIDLNLMVDYEFAIHGPVDKEARRYKMLFNLTAKKINYGELYQFVYISKPSRIVGVSDAFRFLEPVSKEILPKIPAIITPKSNNNDCEEVVTHVELFRGNKNSRAKEAITSIQKGISSLRVEQEEQDKGESEFVDQRRRIFGNKFRKNKQGYMNKVQQRMMLTSAAESQQEPGCRAITSCSNCQRVGSLLRTQTELYSQVKNLAEMNNDLQEQVAQLQKQIELGQAAYQKLSVILMHERELKLFFQAAAQDRAYYQYQIVCVYQHIFMGLDNYRQPIYAIHPILQYAPLITQQMTVIDQASQSQMAVGEPQNPDKYRTEDKVRHGQLLKYKAIIGSQEEKIRTLTEKIAELEASQVQKVKTVMKDIGKFGRGDQLYNNNDGEAVENK